MTDELWYCGLLSRRALRGWDCSVILLIMLLSSCRMLQPVHEPAAGAHAGVMTSHPPDSHQGPFLISEFHRSKGIHTPVLFRLPSVFSAVKQQAILSAVQTWEMVTGKDLFLRVNEQTIGVKPPWRTPIMPYEELMKRGVSKQDCAVLAEAAYDGITDFFFISQWTALFDHCKDFAGIAQAGAFALPALFSHSSHNSDKPWTYISGDIYLNAERFCFRSIKADDCDQHPVAAAVGYIFAYNISLERVVLHELGHVLGLDHVAHLHDVFSIMQPGAGFYVPGLDEMLEMDAMLSPGDITRIHSLYGCKGEACDVRAAHMMQQKSQRQGPPPSQF